MSQELTADDDVAQFFSSSDFDVTESAQTALETVPDRADIQFDGEDEPRTTVGGGMVLGVGTDDENDAIMNEMLLDGIGASFIIERAMLDPDATVIPRGA